LVHYQYGDKEPQFTHSLLPKTRSEIYPLMINRDQVVGALDV
jgi:hypothetical protein